MKNSVKAWLCAFLMGIVLPFVMFSAADKLFLQSGGKDSTDEETEPTQAQDSPQNSGKLLVIQADGKGLEMDVNAYLTGVLLGEMPPEFDVEALKAQAVVARTYALKRQAAGNKHTIGGVCTNSSCCQAYCSVKDYLQKGGSQQSVDKVSNAVQATTGEVLTYNGQLIEATYFSCSGGRTEDALAVWGTDIPYLQAVDSPGEESATHFSDFVTFTRAEFASRLGVTLTGSSAAWFGSVTYTDGGGVDTIMIGGKLFKGTALREKLGLYSTAFTIMPAGDKVHISTKGFGHRVGMSQYGAEAMAVGGSTYREILAHYYPGTALCAD